METKQQRNVQAFRRVQSWSASHPELLQPGSALAKHLGTLNGVVSRLEVNAAAQVTQGKLATKDATDVAQLRAELMTHNMHLVAQVARGLKGSVPGIGILKMPDHHIGSEPLIVAADAMADNAAVYKDVLIEHGLPQNFLDTLRSATAALKANVDARGTAGTRRVAATQAIRSDLKLGRTTVGFMDAVVRGTFRNDAGALAEWRKAKRVTTKGVIGVIDSTTPAAPPAAAPVVPAAASAEVKAA